MELEIYQALTKVNVPPADAKAVVDSINTAIDRRYALHREQLATRGDLQELKGAIDAKMSSLETKMALSQSEIIKWCVGSIFAAVGLFAAITKLWH